MPCDMSTCQCLRCSGKCLSNGPSFLKLCSQGSANGVAFGDGVSGVGYASGVGKMYTWLVEGATGSGLLVGNGFKASSLGSSTVFFFHCPPQL